MTFPSAATTSLSASVLSHFLLLRPSAPPPPQGPPCILDHGIYQILIRLASKFFCGSENLRGSPRHRGRLALIVGLLNTPSQSPRPPRSLVRVGQRERERERERERDFIRNQAEARTQGKQPPPGFGGPRPTTLSRIHSAVHPLSPGIATPNSQDSS